MGLARLCLASSAAENGGKFVYSAGSYKPVGRPHSFASQSTHERGAAVVLLQGPDL